MNVNNLVVNKVIIIGQQLREDPIVTTAQEHFEVPFELYDELNGVSNEAEDRTVLYVTKNFFGDIFEELMKARKCIISHIVLQHCIQQNVALPLPKHPMYNHFLKDAIICFSPINKSQTELVNHYLRLIRFMSGQSRKDMKSGKSFDRTHLIESRTDSDNYRCAVIYGIPIVFKEWIDELWQQRDDLLFDPSDQNLLLKHKIKPFNDLRLAFINFLDENPFELEERTLMEVQTRDNGGEVVDPNADNCTHFVLNATKGEPIDLDKYHRIPDFVVYKNWFTESISIKNREDEECHVFSPLQWRGLSRTPKPGLRSSVSALGVLSPDYDSSFSLDTSAISKSQLNSDIKTTDPKIKSYTYNVCLEMCQTETNYVNTLKAVIRIFRDPLKNHQMDGHFPNEIELKTIFGCLPPIIEVHEKVLLKLENIIQNWSEDNEIGKVFVEHSQQFLTSYPQYVNFHEKTKEMIDECVDKYPKFNSFLKVSQKDPKCGRHTLKELLINPIQRLPRVQLYLEALLKKTDESKSDYNSLKEALNTIVEVNKRINKGKEKTEEQMKMFDMLNDIEDCPATLLSSQRHFISYCDVYLLIKNDINKFEDYLFSLLLFNDLLILCKKRTLKRTNSLSLKGSNNYPNSAGVKKNSKKTYKHIETIELTQIKCILNDEAKEFENSFAITTYMKSISGRSLPTYPFMVKVPEFNKQKFLKDILTTLSEITSKEYQENVIQKQSFKTLDFQYADAIARSVSKSKYAIMRTKEKINRTFSVRRQSLNPAMSLESLHVPTSSPPPSSPSSSRRLSRAFSNFLSPIGLPNRNSSRYLGSMTSMTSLNECSDIEVDNNFSLPTTPAPRKKKCPTMCPTMPTIE